MKIINCLIGILALCNINNNNHINNNKRLCRGRSTYIGLNGIPPARPAPILKPTPCLLEAPTDGTKTSRTEKVAAAINAITTISSTFKDFLGMA